VKRTIAAITAAGILGAATLTPTPAAAFLQLLIFPGLMAKYDKNFKAVNPYAPKKVKMKKHKKHKMKKKM
jgi:hypothetical protein